MGSMNDIEVKLKERLKELKCLFRISELVDYFEDDLESILGGIVEILPQSLQYPENTTVAIKLDNKIYKTDGFHETPWRQDARIKFNNTYIGEVVVCYLEIRPSEYEGPFLKEERLLLNAVAERIGRITERIRAKERLQIEEKALRNKNIAMAEILNQVKSENREVAKRIQSNIDNIVLPILEGLEQELKNTSYETNLKLLKQNLSEIASPLYSSLTREFNTLSPKELQICNMISRGYSSKEIAGLEHISPATVNRHRENIRKKLDLTNRNINLERYLQTYLDQG